MTSGENFWVADKAAGLHGIPLALEQVWDTSHCNHEHIQEEVQVFLQDLVDSGHGIQHRRDLADPDGALEASGDNAEVDGHGRDPLLHSMGMEKELMLVDVLLVHCASQVQNDTVVVPVRADGRLRILKLEAKDEGRSANSFYFEV